MGKGQKLNELQILLFVTVALLVALAAGAIYFIYDDWKQHEVDRKERALIIEESKKRVKKKL